VTPETRVRALAAIDAAHAADPVQEHGRPAERAYAERVERWVTVLADGPDVALELAARAQHLERWVIPRRDYPEGRGGYFRWRKAVQRRQGERATELLRSVGVDDSVVARVAALVAKATPADDRDGQVLEDAACLVFLETELAKFAHEHRDYTAAKMVDILRKTWTRMSPAARTHARALDLPAYLARLLDAALAPGA
jgi:tRNAThr (cytosine32-N3)-methyltransferase